MVPDRLALVSTARSLTAVAPEDLRERDLAVLQELAATPGQVAFQGLRRRLGLHPQALVRTLRHLQEEGLVEREGREYRLTAVGLRAVSGRLPQAGPPRRRPVFMAMLPPHVEAAQAVSRLERRWFQGLRWYGLFRQDDTAWLAWRTESDGRLVTLRVQNGFVALEVEPDPSGQPGFPVVSPLLQALSTLYTAGAPKKARDGRDALPRTAG